MVEGTDSVPEATGEHMATPRRPLLRKKLPAHRVPAFDAKPRGGSVRCIDQAPNKLYDVDDPITKVLSSF